MQALVEEVGSRWPPTPRARPRNPSRTVLARGRAPWSQNLEFLKDTPFVEEKVPHWIDQVCESTMKSLVELQKPFKYIGASPRRPAAAPRPLIPCDRL